MTHTDPTADAFMRRILANPTDPVPRLVFADWLEESGTSSNLAWARYLRLADELATAPADDPRRPKLANELERIGTCVRARLAFRAETFVAYPEEMIRVLPGRNMTVNPATVTVPLGVVNLFPESVAREQFVLPLGYAGGSLFVGTTQPDDQKLSNRLRLVLDRFVVLVGAAEHGLLDAINRSFPSAAGETTEYLLRWLPADGIVGGRPDGPVGRLVELLILEALAQEASAVEFEADSGPLNVWHWFGGIRRRAAFPPPRLLPAIVSHIREVIGAASPGPDGLTVGELAVSYWGRVRGLTVRITDRPAGPHVHITIPPDVPDPPAVLNPAA